MTPNSKGARLRIAVVDDDPAVCSSLKFSLELEGFAVHTFAGGSALLGAPGSKTAIASSSTSACPA